MQKNQTDSSFAVRQQLQQLQQQVERSQAAGKAEEDIRQQLLRLQSAAGRQRQPEQLDN